MEVLYKFLIPDLVSIIMAYNQRQLYVLNRADYYSPMGVIYSRSNNEWVCVRDVTSYLGLNDRFFVSTRQWRGRQCLHLIDVTTDIKSVYKHIPFPLNAHFISTGRHKFILYNRNNRHVLTQIINNRICTVAVLLS